jgi:hypothetical protein
MKLFKKSLLSLIILSSLFNIKAAYSADFMAAESSRCSRYFSLYERKNHMPSNLLRAVAATESGLWSKDDKKFMAWPWTINVSGKGYQYNSKAEVIAAVKKFQAEGNKSIDVGCMQINLKYHPDAFTNLEQAFEPRYNIAYAAKFITDKYAQTGNWEGAIRNYHNANPEFSDKYIALVNNNWRKEDNAISVAWLTPQDRGMKISAKNRKVSKEEPTDVSEITKNVLNHFVR